MPEAHGLQAVEAVDAMRGVALADEGRLREAMATLTPVFAFPASTPLAGRFPALVGRVADVLGAGGRTELGLAVLANAEERFFQDPRDVMLADVWRARAVLLIRRNQIMDGEALLRRAMAQAERQGALGWVLKAALDLAEYGAPASRAEALAAIAGALARMGPGVSRDRQRAVALLGGPPAPQVG
jgi:hypothetical protein